MFRAVNADAAVQRPMPTLGDGFFDRVRGGQLSADRFSATATSAPPPSIGLDALTDAQWLAHFGRFEPLPGSFEQPLALRYHGHQFQTYNPRSRRRPRLPVRPARRRQDGRLIDLGTKGSGRTPWSRGGDGRLTLKGGVREVLATAMLEALGVDTSKTLTLIETGEELERGDEPSPTRGRRCWCG